MTDNIAQQIVDAFTAIAENGHFGGSTAKVNLDGSVELTLNVEVGHKVTANLTAEQVESTRESFRLIERDGEEVQETITPGITASNVAQHLMHVSASALIEDLMKLAEAQPYQVEALLYAAPSEEAQS